MKILLVIIIMLAFFSLGYHYKQKIKNEYYFIIYLKDFSLHLKSNISLFKINIVKLIDEFILFQNEKNAKFSNFFIKNGEIYAFNKEILDNLLSNPQDKNIIFSFASTIGKNDYDFENNKINNFLLFLDERLKEYLANIKQKGDLTLKILIAVGLIISILVW